MTLYGLLQEVYCWRVAPQQSPFPLQLPDAKVVINKYSDNSNVKALLKMPPPIAPQHRRDARLVQCGSNKTIGRVATLRVAGSFHFIGLQYAVYIIVVWPEAIYMLFYGQLFPVLK